MAVDVNKKRKQKEQADRLRGTGGEPVLSTDPKEYRTSLIMAMNYYNREYTEKDAQKWVVTYLAKSNKKLAASLLKLDPWMFRSAGIIAKLLLRDQPVGAMEIESLTTFINKALKMAQEPAPVVVEDEPKTTNVISLRDRIIDKARTLAGEFEGLIDDFMINDETFDAKAVMARLNASGPVAKHIGSFYVDTVKELQEALDGKDPQLKEGYAHIKRSKLKKLLELYQSIIDAAEGTAQSAKAERKPRARKDKPASVVVAKLKYKKEDTELKLKSVLPTTIVNAQELWVFNTKYRKLQVYRASGPKGLTVKGTSIIGYEPEESASKTVRKPELVASYAEMSKRPLTAAYKALKTSESKVNGRINEECILLKVF